MTHGAGGDPSSFVLGQDFGLHGLGSVAYSRCQGRAFSREVKKEGPL